MNTRLLLGVLMTACSGAFVPSVQTAANGGCAGITIPGARCSTVKVPENRTTGKGRTVASYARRLWHLCAGRARRPAGRMRGNASVRAGVSGDPEGKPRGVRTAGARFDLHTAGRPCVRDPDDPRQRGRRDPLPDVFVARGIACAGPAAPRILGDFTGIASYLRGYRTPGRFEGLYLSITCTEDVPFLATDAEAKDAATYLGSYRLREQRAACAEWPRGVVPSWHGQPVRSTLPVVITTGMLDPATRPAGGDAVARTLPNSLHIRVPAGGHALAGLRGLECVAGIKRDFVGRATIEGLDTRCVKNIARPSFDVW